MINKLDIKTISIVVGTRPQIIKSQPVINELKKHGFKIELVNTGQHYDFELSKKIFADLKILKPAINLGIGSGSQLVQISKIITKLEKYFKRKKPDLVIVPGDTSSAIASALATSKCGITLAHLEAGARSNQFNMEEEINRRLIDHCSQILFAPTKNCLKNLEKEAVFGKKFFVGDTMYDLFLEQYRKQNIKTLRKKNSTNKVLITIHRAENIDHYENLRKICKLENKIFDANYEIVFPLHPHTRKNLKKINLKLKTNQTNLLGYTDMLKQLAKSSLVITDSGGLQKEAYWMGKPCITLRDNTEWVETINEHANFLFSLSKKLTLKDIEKISNLRIKPKGSLFGNGKASEKITSIIKKL